MRVINYFLIFVLMSSLAFAITSQVTSFYGQSNPFNITFTGNQNQSFILPIPQYGYVRNVSLKFQNFSKQLVYQEFQNQYSCANTYVYINYTLPVSVTDAIWQVEHNFTTYNVSIPNDCLFNNTAKLLLRFYSYRQNNGASFPAQSYGQCWNGTWKTITNDFSGNIIDSSQFNVGGCGDFVDGDWSTYTDYMNALSSWTQLPSGINPISIISEEAIYWNVSVINITLFYGNSQLSFLSNDTISFNITIINNLLSSFQPLNLTFHSDTVGILQVNLTNATYAYGIDNCSNSFGIPSNGTALNISFYDQINNNKVTANWNGIFNYKDYYNYNFSYTARQNQSFCVYPSWFNSTVTGQIFYSKADYVSKIYYIQDLTTLYLTNQTQNLNLYLISLTNSTTVKITWLTDSYIGVNGILFTYQCTGDGTKTLIETSPIISGDSFVNINLLNSLYSYSVLYNGVLYTNNDTYSKCHIENTNLISYFINTGGGTITPEEGLSYVTCNMSKSSNTSVYMQWSNNPYSDSVITGCLFSYRSGINGKILVDSACENGTSINRTIPVTGYAYDVTGKIYQNGFSKPCTGSIAFNLDNTSAKLFGITGLFCVAFLIISMALFWAGDDIRQQVGAIIGIIIAWIFGLLAFDWAVISAMCFFIIIIMIVGRSATKR